MRLNVFYRCINHGRTINTVVIDYHRHLINATSNHRDNPNNLMNTTSNQSDNPNNLMNTTSNHSDYHIKYKKEREIQLNGTNLYPNIIKKNKLTIYGRIKAIRSSSKKLIFIDLIRDNQITQIILNAKYTHQDIINEIRMKLQIGDWYEFSGEMGVSKTGMPSLFATEAALLAPCLRQIPMELSLNQKHKYQYLNMLVNKDAIESIKTRSSVIKYIRHYLHNEGFVEVETPILCKSAGGASARPFQTTSNEYKIPLYLRIAPELYLKQLIIGGMDKVFEIGKQFRNEGIDSTHNPEFTTLELYQAFTTLEDTMKFTQSFIQGIVKHFKDSAQINYSINNQPIILDFNKDFQVFYVDTELREFFGEIPDLNNQDSITILKTLMDQKNIKMNPPFTLSRIIDKLISEIIEPKCIQPSFIVNHPMVMSPLAKCENGKSMRFELFVGGKEIINSYVELNDPSEQRLRFNLQMKDYQMGDVEAQGIDYEYCDALEYGLPPTVGLGLGIDRLCMLIMETKRIRDVLNFPLM